jgi:hypothetical protein
MLKGVAMAFAAVLDVLMVTAAGAAFGLLYEFMSVHKKAPRLARLESLEVARFL